MTLVLTKDDCSVASADSNIVFFDLVSDNSTSPYDRQVISAAEPMTHDQPQAMAENPEKLDHVVIDRNSAGSGVSPDNADEADEEDTAKYPPRLQLSLLTTALMVTIFLCQLDKSILGNISALGLITARITDLIQ